MSRHNRRAHAAHLRKIKPYVAKLAAWVKTGTKPYPDPVDAARAYEKAGFGPPPVPWDTFEAMIAPSRPRPVVQVVHHKNGDPTDNNISNLEIRNEEET